MKVSEVWVGRLSLEMLGEKEAAAINELRQQLKPTEEPITYERIKELLTGSAGTATHIFVAIIDHRIVGIALLCSMDPLEMGRHDFLQEVVVNKGHRGRRIGPDLIGAVIEHSLAGGALHLSFITEAHRKEAIKIYEKMGFKYRPDKLFFRLMFR